MTVKRDGKTYVRFCDRATLAPGVPRVGRAGRHEVAVFDLGDSVVAYENVCPHQGGPIGEGIVEAGTVTCPWHAWCFDLRTGSMTLGDFARLRRFGVKIDDGAVLVACEPDEEPA
jgi:nitrite reductase (NADH) small subunit